MLDRPSKYFGPAGLLRMRNAATSFALHTAEQSVQAYSIGSGRHHSSLFRVLGVFYHCGRGS